MIVTVGAEKGGVGKTRLATHLACLAACQNIDVVLLDTDKQGSAVSWSRIRSEQGVEPQFPVFSLPPKPAKELANLSAKFDLVVVDIGAQNYMTMLECMMLSDLVLVPCGPDQQEVESTLNVFDAIKQMDPRHPKGKVPAHVVLTRISHLDHASETRQLRELLAEEGVDVFDAQLPYRACWKTSGKTGRAVHELKGKDRSEKAVAEMQAVFDEIFRRHKD